MQTALTFVAILSIVMLFLCGTWPTFILLAVLTAISMVCCIVVSYILRKRTDEKDAKDAVLQNKIICRRRAGTKTPFRIEQNLSYRAKLRVNVLSSGSTVRRAGTVCT